ncbi:ribose 5-phosphate isomerase B [Clostridium thermosuccinogenes]|uniref:Ribose 5-phosphate isomerase B n=1 Tax=Clostridium thermosuccinogenes TaxID=84032 RepID=A0A2K2FKZ1_9CLOT|nr:ribose 5-phosphate isomerase B [Pseudoclostridium thermosuccinogenes]AUS96055.1 ribose 5-phosphate isomerase B [Pseudoclostridium thermosuccinogenes]PNT99443.1 ribose 5-phosphate isomerase B [Pseudoclostridium thermosuccinogenes]PNU01130.1 ribose 5-phosphate isomerase B [Pseudoclostridium thermosuccinogenes]
MKHIVIGCDNAAFDLKMQITKMLKQDGVEYEDVGVYSVSDEKMYPLIAKEVAERIIESGYKKEGILLCGTGIGMAITANKYRGIYAAVCHDIYSAERARLSNNTNVITMGARVIGCELAKKIVKEWLKLEFKPGSSSPKIEKIYEIEKSNFMDK